MEKETEEVEVARYRFVLGIEELQLKLTNDFKVALVSGKEIILKGIQQFALLNVQ